MTEVSRILDQLHRAYAIELREIAKNAETSRPELEWARVYLGSK